MARKKAKKPAAPAKVSPEKYIQTKARSLPLNECLINPDWQVSGLATILISRLQPSGNLTIGVYLVDVFCLGLKNTHHYFNETEYIYEYEIIDLVFTSQDYEPCKYVLAHNIIYGAIEYADDLGFRPNKDFAVSQYVLEDDDDQVELMELEFGKDGKPCYIVGPYDNASLITGKLKATVGEGNFTVIHPEANLFGEDYFEDEEWEEEDDFDPYEDVTEDRPDPYQVQLLLPPGNPSGDPSSSREITYTVTHDAVRDERYKAYYKALGEDEVERLFALTANKPQEAIPVLQELITQYPHFPTLQNYLSVAYQTAGREAESGDLVEEMYRAFPDYLFTRLSYANQFLHKGDLDRVAEIMENKFEIKEFFPEREVFHFSEILYFYALVGEYLLAKGGPEKALPYLDLMLAVDPKHPLTDRLGLKVMPYVMEEMQKKLLGE